MTKKPLPGAYFVIATIITVLLTNVLLLATEQGGSSVTVVGTVLPQRLIVVDENLTIRKVISNTSEEIRPTVVLGEVDGKEIPYSASIIDEYQFIKPTLDFSQPGIVYERDDRPIPALLKRIWRRISMWFR